MLVTTMNSWTRLSESLYYETSLGAKEENVQKIMFNQVVGGHDRTQLAFFVNGCTQVFIFCIAFPLACFVVFFKGVRLLYRLSMSLSFTCCVWIFLAALTLLFLLVFIIQFAVASVG